MSSCSLHNIFVETCRLLDKVRHKFLIGSPFTVWYNHSVRWALWIAIVSGHILCHDSPCGVTLGLHVGSLSGNWAFCVVRRRTSLCPLASKFQLGKQLVRVLAYEWLTTFFSWLCVSIALRLFVVFGWTFLSWFVVSEQGPFKRLRNLLLLHLAYFAGANFESYFSPCQRLWQLLMCGSSYFYTPTVIKSEFVGKGQVDLIFSLTWSSVQYALLLIWCHHMILLLCNL